MNTKLLHLLAFSLLAPSAYGAQQVITPGAGVTAAAGRDMINANFTELYGLPWYSIVPSANGTSLVSAANYAAMRALLDLEPDTDFPTIASVASTYVPITRTINGSALSSNVTITTITGNAGTATALATPRAINGTNFDGSAAITVTAAAGTLTGPTINATVTGSSLTSAAGGAFGTGAYAATPTRATLGLATSDSPVFTAVSSRLLATDGTAAAPSISFSNASGVGFRKHSTFGAVFSASGADIWFTAASNINMRNNGLFAWVATTDPTSTIDTAFGRNAAGVAEVNNGTAGTYRDLRVRSIIAQPPATITPASNGDMVFEATSNTSVTLKMKGTDGTVRSVVLTLAP